MHIERSSYKKVFAFFVLFRVLNMFINKTWFVPDEYWQSQEVAHYLTFNYGYLTWEWRVGIRSYLYPAVISLLYKCLQFINLDHTILLIYIVPFMHSLLTSAADLYFFLFVRKFYGEAVAFRAGFCRLISWFTIYMSSRSLTNNIEEIFTAFCLYSMDKFPLRNNKSFLSLHLFAFFSFVIRSTAAINLAPIYLYNFFFLCNTVKLKLRFFYQFICVGVSVIGLGVLIDSYFNGAFLISWYNFFLYNVYHNIGVHYGTHAWYWYFLEGLPTILFTNLVVFIIGLSQYKNLYFPISVTLFNILAYSLLEHKEFRFLYQTMPFLTIICAHGILFIERKFSQKLLLVILSFLTMSNLLLAIFLGVLHQSAPINLMHHLRSELTEENSVLFLTPCHSTPYYSYLHKNVSMRFLTCEPNLNLVSNYLDEADAFYANPFHWYNTNHDQLKNITHLVLFENLYKTMSDENEHKKNDKSLTNFLSKFTICERFFHSFILHSKRNDKYLLLLCRDSKQQTERRHSYQDEL